MAVGMLGGQECQSLKWGPQHWKTTCRQDNVPRSLTIPASQCGRGQHKSACRPPNPDAGQNSTDAMLLPNPGAMLGMTPPISSPETYPHQRVLKLAGE